MSKAFYSILADQLCSFKNSPFSKLSDLPNPDFIQNNQSRHIRNSKRLSFNADRLFSPQKYKEQHRDQKQFQQFQRQQKQNLQRIQITLLQQKTHQQLKKLQQKTNLLSGKSFIHPYTIFKVYRGLCKSCNKCYQYHGNFNLGNNTKISRNNYEDQNQQTVQYLCCMTCNCPMNSHISISHKNKYKKQIFNYLSSNLIQSDHMNFKHYPICFLINNKTSLNTIMNNFYNYFPQLGFKIKSYEVYNKKKYENFLIKKQILMINQNQTVQKLINLVQFLSNQNNWNIDINLSQQIDQSQYQTLKKINSNVHSNIQQYFQKQNQNSVIILYVNTINKFQYSQLQTILRHYQNILNCDFLFTPKTQKQRFISSCVLFPQYFKLNHQIFILPSQKTNQQAQKVSARFKDILDYNNYVTIGHIKQLQKDKFQTILKYQNYNKVNYILGQQQLNKTIKRARIQLSAKVGPSIFTIPFKNAVDFIQISSLQKKSPFMIAFPQYLRSQRCFIILRPCFSFANLSQVLMSILRINQFILLKRRKVVFSEQQARYLATIQKIQPEYEQSYIKIMTSGMSQIVLVSKRGAIYQANILLNGSSDGPSQLKTKILKNLPSLTLKRGLQTYQYNPIIYPIQQNQNQCFKSFHQLFKIQSVLFHQFQGLQTKYVTNIKNGELVKIQSDQKQRNQLKMSSKIKQSLLNQLKKDNFNYWIMTSKSQLLTEQLAGMFFPQTTLFQSCVVIVKPKYTHLVQKIKQALFQHRYHIIMQKTVQLSRNLAKQIIHSIQKIKMNQNQLKKVIQTYSNQKIHIFCISKIFAKHQIFSLLSQFSFLANKSIIIDDYIDDDNLKQILVPVWNNQQLILKILSAPLYNVEEGILSLYSPSISNQDKFQILNYLVGSFYGISINDINMNSSLGKLSYYLSNPLQAHLQSWFYSQLSKQHSRHVPTLFQYRNIASTCFVIQSNSGQPFLNIISNQYQEEQKKLLSNNQNNHRESMILYLWGKKIAQFIYRVTLKQANMRGWGKIAKIQNQWQGQNQSKQTLKNIKKLLISSQQKLQNMLSLYDNKKNNQKHNQKQNTRKILANIQRLIESRFLAQKYPSSTNTNKNKENLQYVSQKRIIPFIPENKIQQCFRIIQSQQTQKLSLVDKYAMIDPDHQKINDKSLYTLNLYNVEPSIGTKQQLVAQVIVFLLKWEKQTIQQKVMFKKLLQSLIIHCLQFCQIDVLQPEIYIQLLKQYMQKINSRQYSLNKNSSLFIDFLVNYPNLRKIVNNSNSNNINDQISGKKRKFLQKKQYYIDKSQELTQNQKYLINKQYLSFNLNYQTKQRYLSQQHVNEDPLYRKFALQQKNITLLRQVQPASQKQKKGIYVQFQKRITQNEQQLINKIKGQVDKFNVRKDEKILYETGLQKDLWYRKVKQEKVNMSTMNKQSKLNDAINKQIGKFINFKQQFNKSLEQK